MRTKDYRELKLGLHTKVLDDIDWESLNRLDERTSREQVSQHLNAILRRENTPLTYAERQSMCDEVLDELFGLGPLESLLADPDVSDILVNGPKTVYVERKGILERTDVGFND